MVLVDGVLCDGAGVAARGWAWFDALGSCRGSGRTRIASGAPGRGPQLLAVQMYAARPVDA